MTVMENVTVPDTVPAWEGAEGSTGADVSAMLRAVICAASGDKGMPVLAGVRVEFPDDGGIRMAATDRFRLHSVGIGCDPTPDDEAPCVIVPAKTLKPYVQSVKKAYAVSFAAAGGLSVTVRTSDGSTHATIPALDGDYPKLGKLLRDMDARKCDGVSWSAFNPAYLGDAMDAASWCCDRNTAARATFGEKGRPLMVDTDPSFRLRFVGLVMPLRAWWADGS